MSFILHRKTLRKDNVQNLVHFSFYLEHFVNVSEKHFHSIKCSAIHLSRLIIEHIQTNTKTQILLEKLPTGLSRKNKETPATKGDAGTRGDMITRKVPRSCKEK